MVHLPILNLCNLLIDVFDLIKIRECLINLTISNTTQDENHFHFFWDNQFYGSADKMF
jgi:hypothetical protein